MLVPKRVKYRRPHRVPHDRGFAKGGREVQFGEYGLQALTSGWITNRQIESARVALTRYMKRQGKVWIRIFPHLAKTAKPLEVTRISRCLFCWPTCCDDYTLEYQCS